MKGKIITLFMFSLMAFHSNASTRVRRVAVQGRSDRNCENKYWDCNDHSSSRINQIVLWSAIRMLLRVEYLDQAITIKPLSHGSKSNLYIYTDWKRFNVELVSGAESVADYVVYLDNPKAKNARFNSLIKTRLRYFLDEL
jgi:hypothetical protein